MIDDNTKIKCLFPTICRRFLSLFSNFTIMIIFWTDSNTLKSSHQLTYTNPVVMNHFPINLRWNARYLSFSRGSKFRVSIIRSNTKITTNDIGIFGFVLMLLCFVLCFCFCSDDNVLEAQKIWCPPLVSGSKRLRYWRDKFCWFSLVYLREKGFSSCRIMTFSCDAQT